MERTWGRSNAIHQGMGMQSCPRQRQSCAQWGHGSTWHWSGEVDREG